MDQEKQFYQELLIGIFIVMLSVSMAFGQLIYQHPRFKKQFNKGCRMLASPKNVVVRKEGSDINIEWQFQELLKEECPSIIFFKVYRNNRHIGNSKCNTCTHFTDKSVSKGQKYCYTISSFNGRGHESPPSFKECVSY